MLTGELPGMPTERIASDRWQLNLALVAAVAEHWLSHCAACLLAQEMLCCTKGTDVSHEANGEAVCPGVCELLQLAMLKYFFFKVIKLLSAQVMQRGCSCSVLSALLCSCCPFLPVLLCSCCSVQCSLLCDCGSLLSELLCSCCPFLSVLLSSNSSSCSSCSNNSSSSSSSSMFSSSLPGCIQSCQMAWPHSSASGQSGCTCSSAP